MHHAMLCAFHKAKQSLVADKVIEALAEIASGTPLAATLERRSDILGMSQAAHEAALSPREPGGLSHAERAALAERMARLHEEPRITAHYAALLARTGAEEAQAELRDPRKRPSDARQAALAAHADMLTRAPREATRGAIDALRQAGVSEPDIVRLSELAAFVNYQIRVVAGLRLLRETT